MSNTRWRGWPSRRVLAWLTIGLSWSLVFWLVVWPKALLYSAGAGLVGGLVVHCWCAPRLPRARALDAAERTWRRLS